MTVADSPKTSRANVRRNGDLRLELHYLGQSLESARDARGCFQRGSHVRHLRFSNTRDRNQKFVTPASMATSSPVHMVTSAVSQLIPLAVRAT